VDAVSKAEVGGRFGNVFDLTGRVINGAVVVVVAPFSSFLLSPAPPALGRLAPPFLPLLPKYSSSPAFRYPSYTSSIMVSTSWGTFIGGNMSGLTNDEGFFVIGGVFSASIASRIRRFFGDDEEDEDSVEEEEGVGE